jgi:hypothetical protein
MDLDDLFDIIASLDKALLGAAVIVFGTLATCAAILVLYWSHQYPKMESICLCGLALPLMLLAMLGVGVARAYAEHTHSRNAGRAQDED